jgi:hypothetical protein
MAIGKPLKGAFAAFDASSRLPAATFGRRLRARVASAP